MEDQEQKMIAHINADGEEQTIKEHLEGCAKRAKVFADEFGCGELGCFCGMMHDIGKYSIQFQKRIRDPEHTKKVDHATAGAKEAMAMSVNYLPFAMVIAGHHSGLQNCGNCRIAEEYDGTFWGRMKTSVPEYTAWKQDVNLQKPMLPSFCMKGEYPRFTLSFFIRMLYSCLVDADYLDTEHFMNGNIGRGGYSSTNELLLRFEAYIQKWFQNTEYDSAKQKQIYEKRNQILLECMEKGEKWDRGLYTLTVPTGGGKTTASLGFTLKHMQKNEMQRIIYVIPYTSIIDQNAEVFTKILGEENVLEHHCGVLYEVGEGQEADPIAYRKALATENWDAPVIMTTAVQFFESLFANRSAKCRKLHNLANSVIIFDEAQMLPIPYLEPCVAAISELIAHYRSTVVLCTATQPALDGIFKKYLPDVTIKEICSEVEEQYRLFRRATICNVGVICMEELQKQLAGNSQVLCIVNKRKTAQELYCTLPGEGNYCLTTLLYPEHRKQLLAEIRQRLRAHLPCRVVATSLVEAGVDLDFPKVYRQEIGLDSLLQSAGRCNREGKRSAEESVVMLFRLEGENSPYFQQNIDALRETMRHYEDPASPEAIVYYFRFYRSLVGTEALDQKEIIKAFEKGVNGAYFPFAEINDRFQMIDNPTKTIYIPEGEAAVWVEEVRERPTRELFRRLGRYSVNVYPEHFQSLWEAGCLENVDDRIYVLRDGNQYREDTGLQLDVETGFGVYI